MSVESGTTFFKENDHNVLLMFRILLGVYMFTYFGLIVTINVETQEEHRAWAGINFIIAIMTIIFGLFLSGIKETEYSNLLKKLENFEKKTNSKLTHLEKAIDKKVHYSA